MKTYKIIIKIDNFESEIIEIKAENWEEAINHILGKIEIIDTEE